MEGIEYHKRIVSSVFKRYWDGDRLNNIDKINYYKARGEYYKTKASETEDEHQEEIFKHRQEVSERAWKTLEYKASITTPRRPRAAA